MRDLNSKPAWRPRALSNYFLAVFMNQIQLPEVELSDLQLDMYNYQMGVSKNQGQLLFVDSK